MMRCRRTLAALATLAVAAAPLASHADNAMGYRLLSPEDAAALPQNHGALGLQVQRGQQISDQGLTFDIMKVVRVAPGSAGAAAGFKLGDQIIAVDGDVFPTIATFAAYVGSHAPRTAIQMDTMPAGAGPQQAQRITVVLGEAGSPAPQNAHGLTTGTKVAIGVGAAALLCYEMGCFSHHPHQMPPGRPGPMPAAVPHAQPQQR